MRSAVAMKESLERNPSSNENVKHASDILLKIINSSLMTDRVTNLELYNL